MNHRIISIVALTFLTLVTNVVRGDDAALLGRWDLTVQGADGEYPSWLEVKKSGHSTLVGSYVGQFGSARPIAEIKNTDGTYQFTVPPQWEERSDDVTHKFTLASETLSGETTDDNGKKISWKGKRAPSLKRDGKVEWGKSTELFNGKDLTGWTTQLDTPNGWVVQDGLLYNKTPGLSLIHI